ncbi:helix-turn-helix domain-containing protein [Mucilaginibacter agri]|uniref:Helix-turn-helix domain-containing protein n=1 Tax=Mucilaginibacter agri TaxID=2695265 RepID=A0A965ZI42_9SPHI|nr:helix-turn-helix domain-containing protein [Mucilaginibacter agri]
MKNQLLSDLHIVSNIKSLRISKAYSQDYLANKLNISQNAYSKLELGRSKLTVDRLLEIANILDVEIMEIFVIQTTEPDHSKAIHFDRKATNQYHWSSRVEE